MFIRFSGALALAALTLASCADGAATVTGQDATADTADAKHVDADPNTIWCTDEQMGMQQAWCDDGNACTEADTCKPDGKCQGVIKVCDDNKFCTADSCDPLSGNCVNKPYSTPVPCNDKDECTTGDQCNSAGTCNGTPIALNACDDKFVCTTDTCNPATGCVHTFVPNATCEDGDKCTFGEICLDGVCKAGTPIECNDTNSCTIDTCNPQTGVCSFKAFGSGQPCDDGNGCTVGDACQQANCVSGKMTDCNDNDACTSDSCNSGSGACEHVFTGSILLPCTDNNKCTTGDQCVQALGKCQGKPTDCKDGNECTEDVCETNVGCINKPADGLSCSDGVNCTSGDKCSQGKCQGVKIACSDNNPCTSDSCNELEGSCQHQALTSVPSCDDGNACTKDDKCSSGGYCTGSQTQCTDGNECTTDTCDTVAGCKYANVNGIACSDGSPCTTGDQCKEGTCKAKVDLCNDGNGCTIDKCNADGSCTNTPLDANLYTCSDSSNLCVSKDGGVCAAGGVCKLAPKCTTSEKCKLALCDPNTGACKIVPDTSPTCAP